MWDLQRRGSCLHGKIRINLAKEKLTETRTACSLPEYFLSKDHNVLINDVEIVFIEKTEAASGRCFVKKVFLVADRALRLIISIKISFQYVLRVKLSFSSKKNVMKMFIFLKNCF